MSHTKIVLFFKLVMKIDIFFFLIFRNAMPIKKFKTKISKVLVMKGMQVHESHSKWAFSDITLAKKTYCIKGYIINM